MQRFSVSFASCSVLFLSQSAQNLVECNVNANVRNTLGINDHAMKFKIYEDGRIKVNGSADDLMLVEMSCDVLGRISTV